MSSIIKYGVCLPHFRVEDVVLHPRGKKNLSKAVSFTDEDILTLSFEAAYGLKSQSIDGILFATSTPVFKGRTLASFLADLLNLPTGILAMDLTGSARSGTDALVLADSLIASGKCRNVLVVASDVLFPEPGKELSTPFGHAAVAILMGKEKGMAKLTRSASFSASLAEEFDYKSEHVQLDPRYSRDAGFKTNITTSLKTFVSEPKKYDSVILNSLYARMAGGIFAKAGFDEKQFSRDALSSSLGNTGSAHALLLLLSDLERGKKNILLADYTNGSNFFEIESAAAETGNLLQDELKGFTNIPTYQDYLSFRKAGNFSDAAYRAKEMFSSEMMNEREKESLIWLKALKCESCGTIYYLKTGRCKKCKSEKFSTTTLSREGTIYSLTNEHYFPATFPPVTMAVIDLDGGGRITVQQTDSLHRGEEPLKIGSRVKLVLRKMIENDLKPDYFWKCIHLQTTN